MFQQRVFLLILVLLSVLKPSWGARYQIAYQAGAGAFGENIHSKIGGDSYIRNILMDATEFVLETFHQKPDEGRKNDRVILTFESFKVYKIDSFPFVAAQTVGNKIRFNTDYLEVYEGDITDMKEEFAGILYHESTRVWQWDGSETAPKGLITGVSDYVRLKAGKPAKGWPERGSGSSWDEGHAVTAYFLEYCNELRDGFVADLNAKLRDYYSDDFFEDLLGKSVDELWNDYQQSHKIQMVCPVSDSCLLTESNYNRKFLKSHFQVEFSGVLKIRWIRPSKGRERGMDPEDSAYAADYYERPRASYLPHNKAEIDFNPVVVSQLIDEDGSSFITKLKDLKGKLKTLYDSVSMFLVPLAILILIGIPAYASCYLVLHY